MHRENVGIHFLFLLKLILRCDDVAGVRADHAHAEDAVCAQEFVYELFYRLPVGGEIAVAQIPKTILSSVGAYKSWSFLTIFF